MGPTDGGETRVNKPNRLPRTGSGACPGRCPQTAVPRSTPHPVWDTPKTASHPPKIITTDRSLCAWAQESRQARCRRLPTPVRTWAAWAEVARRAGTCCHGNQQAQGGGAQLGWAGGPWAALVLRGVEVTSRCQGGEAEWAVGSAQAMCRRMAESPRGSPAVRPRGDVTAETRHCVRGWAPG